MVKVFVLYNRSTKLYFNNKNMELNYCTNCDFLFSHQLKAGKPTYTKAMIL